MKTNNLNNEKIQIAFDLLRKFVDITITNKRYQNQITKKDELIHQKISINSHLKKLIDEHKWKEILNNSDFDDLLNYFQDNKLYKNSEVMEVLHYLIRVFPGQIEVTLW
ncbi:hypothetical protein KKC17_02670 [Patescibacteria group bacterium]|nr:hypothetical protein [Patescibacteria group bacterium]